MFVLKNLLIGIVLVVSLFGQVPQGVIGSMWEMTFPELQAYIIWQPVSGASGYKIYEYVSAMDFCPSEDSAYAYDTTITDSWYLDDPNPGWYLVDVNDRGGWQNRWWCYEVSAIVGNVESARSKPVQVAIGSSGWRGSSDDGDIQGSRLRALRSVAGGNRWSLREMWLG